jgi:hypothetical protein
VQRERVAEDIYVFAIDLYAQVTATVIVTSEGVVLFDTLLPHFVDGSFDDLLTSLEGLSGVQYENIIQVHGDVILRGDIAYLHALRAAVDSVLDSPIPDQALAAIGIESCGKSRVLLNGAADRLHCQNVFALANQRIIEA